MKKIRAAAFLCTLLFAVGILAQIPGTQPNQSAAGSSQMPQTSQPPQATPPSQNTPSTPQEPSAQPPSQAQHNSNIDDQVQILTTELNLTPGQQEKVRTVLNDQHQQAMTVVQDNSMSREDKLSKIHSLRETTITKVRQVLTATQQPKFDEMIANMRQRQEGGGSPGGNSPTGGSPGSTTPPASTPPATTPPPNSTPPTTKPPQ